MKRLTRVAVVCLCVLAPASARADDGGWWDNFWKFDAKFMGIGSDFHALCLGRDPANNNRTRVIHGCEEWFRNFSTIWERRLPEHDFQYETPKNPADASDPAYVHSIKELAHEIDVRFGYYQNRGARYNYDENTPDDAVYGRISVERLMGMYYFYPNPQVAVGGGAGMLRVHGDRFDPFYKSIVTASIVAYPPRADAMFVRLDVNNIPGGFKSEDFGDPAGLLNKETEWNFSIAIGFDLRRVGRFGVKR